MVREHGQGADDGQNQRVVLRQIRHARTSSKMVPRNR
jgi:hypothetical protein